MGWPVTFRATSMTSLTGEAHPVAQVEHVVVPALQQVVQGQNVGLSQVRDVDIVPDAGTVLGGVVVAEDGDLLPLAVGHLEDQGIRWVSGAWASPMAPEGGRRRRWKYRRATYRRPWARLVQDIIFSMASLVSP